MSPSGTAGSHDGGSGSAALAPSDKIPSTPVTKRETNGAEVSQLAESHR